MLRLCVGSVLEVDSCVGGRVMELCVEVVCWRLCVEVVC